jgi:cytochrome P450
VVQEARLSLSEIDLNNLDHFVDRDMHEVWRLLRAEAPVFWSEGTSTYPGFWSLTKHEDVLAVSLDPETFISGLGVVLSAPARATANSPVSMMNIDPPRHVRLRGIVNKPFTPHAIAALEPQIRKFASDILDNVAPYGRCDFVEDIAGRLPLAVICSIMGVPEADWEFIFQQSKRWGGSNDPEYQIRAGDRRSTQAQADRELLKRLVPLLPERHRTPGEDVMSVLAGATLDGQPFTDRDILRFCRVLLQAGNETTRSAIAGGMLALIEHPEEKALLLSDPSLIPIAVEEILRWSSPVLHIARTATRAVQIRGQYIQARQRVVLWYPSANREEEVFPEPYHFDVRRTPNNHLTFGVGEHFCLGAGLARLEIRVLFEELLQRLPDIELDGKVERLRSNFFGGIKHMPVRFTPQPRRV